MKALILQKRETKDTEAFHILARGSARLVSILLLGLVLITAAAPPAIAYTGGPIPAYIGGLEPKEQRAYYYLVDHSGAAIGPRVWHFDLDGASPEKPVSASQFDGRDGVRLKDSRSDAWLTLASGLLPLPPLDQFDLRIALSGERAGQDSLWMTPRYKGSLLVETRRIGRTGDITLYCEAMIRIRGPYGIPRRPEAIVVITCKGRAYGCEEIERPVLLFPKGQYDRSLKMSGHEFPPARGDASPQASKRKFPGLKENLSPLLSAVRSHDGGAEFLAVPFDRLE